MNNNTISMQGLLQKYKLDEPLPEKIQKDILKNKNRNYKKILKSAGKYSFLTGLFASIYFFIKKFGVSITTAKSIISITAVVGISTGAYFTAPYVAEQFKTEDISISLTEKIDAPGKKPFILKAPDPVTIGIMPFIGTGVDKEILNRAANVIAGELSRKRGKGYAGNFGTVAKNNARYSMFGSIEKVDEMVLLTVKIVDIKTSKMLHMSDEKLGSIDELDSACKRIALEISEKVE